MPTALQDFYFEDFEAGQRFVSGGLTVTESMIVAFALTYDPQPMHMDRIAAENGAFGGLIAPGVMTLSLAIRLTVDIGIFRACNLGSTGIDELRWMKPVRPNDCLHVEIEVKEARASASKPDRGVLSIAVTTCNQSGEAVMSYKNVLLVRRRPK